MSLRHQEPQALFLSFLAFTPCHEITNGTRATGAISEVQTKPQSTRPEGSSAEAAQSHQEPLAQAPPLFEKGAAVKKPPLMTVNSRGHLCDASL